MGKGTTTFTCPQCGQVLCIEISCKAEPTGHRPQKVMDGMRKAVGKWQTFNQTAPSLPQVVKVIKPPQKITPSRVPTKEGDVEVPLLQAVICGCGCGIVVLMVSVGIVLNNDIALWKALTTTGIATALGATGAWFLLLIDTRKLLRTVENIVGMDLNHDGQIGNRGPASVSTPEIIINVTDEEKHTVQRPRTRIPPQVLREVAQAVLLNKCAFSRRGLMGPTSISDGQVEELQRLFIAQGWARYKDGKPNKGVELIAKGRAVMRGFLEGGLPDYEEENDDEEDTGE